MEKITVFLSTFILVFIGELGDKTQIAAGTGALANKNKMWVIFFSSAVALMSVAGLTVFGASFIPDGWIPIIKKVGGVLLALYGVYLFNLARKGDSEEDGEESFDKHSLALFMSHFLVVFVAELGDKTQIATLAVAIENQTYPMIVFAGSASALVSVTGLTVWGVAKIPDDWIKSVQYLGATLMVLYGAYMLYST